MDRGSVVVGMSGGVDSFVTALLLKEAGYKVYAVVLKLWQEPFMPEVSAACRQLDIPFCVKDAREYFRKTVITAFVEGYLSGETPSPCCLCNSAVKWELLHRAALELEVDKVATGHYVNIAERNGYTYFCRGIDEKKDQSYFLWGVSQDILRHAVTPLGKYTKAEVKALAESRGFRQIAEKKESMGVCFLAGRDYRDFIRQREGVVSQSGGIYTREGEKIGEHDGLLNYTVGQKRGIPLWRGQQLYVAGMEPEKNVLVVDVKDGLNSWSLEIENAVIPDPAQLQTGDVTVKVRGLGINPKGYVRVQNLGGNAWRVDLSDPAWAVAPGQPLAFYKGEILVGGGIIRRKKCL